MAFISVTICHPVKSELNTLIYQTQAIIFLDTNHCFIEVFIEFSTGLTGEQVADRTSYSLD